MLGAAVSVGAAAGAGTVGVAGTGVSVTNTANVASFVSVARGANVVSIARGASVAKGANVAANGKSSVVAPALVAAVSRAVVAVNPALVVAVSRAAMAVRAETSTDPAGDRGRSGHSGRPFDAPIPRELPVMSAVLPLIVIMPISLLVVPYSAEAAGESLS